MAKYDLTLGAPLMNAAGSLGFTLPAHGILEWDRFGAFVTNPISFGRRQPANNAGQITFSGGFLLHTGYPNPGFETTLRRNRAAWAYAPLPVLMHLIPRNANELADMIPPLEACENILGLEIGIAPDSSLDEAADLLRAALSELPIILRLPLDRALELADGLDSLEDGRISALSLGPPRGVLPLPDGGFFSGRIYGPAVLPTSLAVVRALSQGGLPIIGAGGVYRQQDINAMLAAGAIAVQLDSVLWRGGIE